MAPATSTTADSERRPSVSSIRTGLRQTRAPLPGSPHTPQQRQVLSPYTASSSPGTPFRQEEDAVIMEIGSRWLRAGFEGNSAPTCVVGFGPEEARRVGDYRGWIRRSSGPTTDRKGCRCNKKTWSKSYELWNSDIRDFDMKLFEDKIERAIREIYNKFLLTDAGSSKLVLVLPSIVPHPLLDSLLSTIFNRWKYPSITLLPAAAMVTIAAGLRSSLVVDIGWEETTVTAIYEYREIQSKRSTRAVKIMMQEMGKLLSRVVQENGGPDFDESNDTVSVPFELCEETLTRLAWCKKSSQLSRESSDSDDPSDSSPDSTGDFGDLPSHVYESKLALPLPIGSDSNYTDVPFSRFSEVVEDTLFGSGYEHRDWDDEDMPLDILVYQSLLSLAPDIRGCCMSRIIFSGGGANIPGLRQRVLDDVNALITKNQWSLTKGKNVGKRKKHLQELNVNERNIPPNDLQPEVTSREPLGQESNFIDEKFEKIHKDTKPYIHGVLRQVDSLGPWVGASLLASLKVKGLVEIDREKYLQHGLTGASRESDLSVLSDRKLGYGAGSSRPGGDRSSWTLGEWG